jgi:hypothetical protein
MAVCAERKKPCRRAVSAFVLTFPFPLRFLLAAQPEALTQVLAVVQRGISTFVVQHSGLTVASGARTGAVTPTQRFGSALNLSPHLGNCSCAALPPASLQACTCCSWTAPTLFAATGQSSTAPAGPPAMNSIARSTASRNFFDQR